MTHEATNQNATENVSASTNNANPGNNANPQPHTCRTGPLYLIHLLKCHVVRTQHLAVDWTQERPASIG